MDESQCLQAGPELSTPAYDMHVVNTIKRLQCIQQQITHQQNVQATCRELLEWCSDVRAFTPTFEPYLMECLEVLKQCAHLEGFDLDLTYRVMSICSANGEKFDQKAAGLLKLWSEELAKSLLSRHELNQSHRYTADTGSGSQNPQYQLGMQQPVLRKQYSTGDGSQLNWPVEAGPPAGTGRNGLSVVTTVWGMTPGTQTVGPQHTSVPYENMPMYGRGPGQPRPQTPTVAYAPQPSGQAAAFYRHNSLPSGPGPGAHTQYRPTYNPSAPNGNADYQPPPGALSAAAMVAAAATATATATATASMMVQQDPQQPVYHRQPTPAQHPTQVQMANPAYGMQHYSQRPGVRLPSAPMMVGREMVGREMPTGQQMGQQIGQQMGGGPMSAQTPYRRPSPYGNPQQMMMQRKAQYGSNMPTSPQFAQMTQQPTTYNPAEHAQFASQMRQPSNMMAMQGTQPVTYGNVAPPPYSGATGPFPNQMNRTAQPQAMPSQPPYQNGYMMAHNPQDIKPVLALPPATGGDLQLTFPIRDGTILPAFRLEHNLSVSYHMFHLKDQIFQTLMDRPDFEVQLKCFHHEDRYQSPNWPASVSVSVNNRTLLTDGEQQRNYHRPLYFKNICVPGKNTITISVGTCCCSHLFVLQLVHRPTVRSILHGLLRKRFLPAEHCINKIKANFANTNLSGMAAADADGVEQTSVKISLKCPITFRRIMLPARGSECRHIQCFDLEAYLQLNADRGIWKCPVCNKNALLEGLEIDQYMWGIIDQLTKTEVDEINIDANASWKPDMPKMVTAKEEDSKGKVCGVNSWMKVYSPSSTNLPSQGSYEGHHNPMSPYPTPPNSHNSQGSNSIAHFNGGVYDVGFNSPPDFTGPMSNRSDMSETDKRLVVLQRQQSGMASPSQGPPSNAAPPSLNNYGVPPGGPASNAPPMLPSGPGSNMAPGGPPSNAPMSQGPPSNAPASQGPPSNRPASHGGPASNAPVSNTSPNASNNPTTAVSSELPPDISDLVNSTSNDSLALEGLDELDLLAYLGPQDRDLSNDNTSFPNTTSTVDADEILALFPDP